MNETICRLCLNTVSENYHMIGETVKFFLKLNLDVSKETVMCMECTNNLQVFLNLKSACVDMKRRALLLSETRNYVNFDPGKTENTIDLKSVAVSKNKTKCSFCTKSTEKESLTSLLESKDNMFLVDTLEKYIPELSLSNNGELLSCETCLDQMQSVSSFLMKCLDIEENISEYAELKGTDDKGQIELQDVQQFMINPTLKFEGGACNVNKLEQTYDQIQEIYLVKTEGEIKYEMEMDDVEPIFETEFVTIKSEQGDCDSFQEPSTKFDDKNSLDVSVSKRETDTYETAHKDHPNDHISVQNGHSGRKKFKCETCGFTTKSEQFLNKHKLAHRAEPIIYKCDICSYETKRNNRFNEHILIHKNSSDVTMLKCELCTFETKVKRYLSRHKVTHKNPAERTMFKCEMCTFAARHRRNLKRHMLTHKGSSEVTNFKCEMCEFVTKHKYALKRHILIHDSSLDMPVYKCENCTFETNHKYRLTEHILIHKSPSELEMFKCEMCQFETKRKYNLKRHLLVHKNSSEETKFRCELCMFETPSRRNLEQHELIHKVESDVTNLN